MFRLSALQHRSADKATGEKKKMHGVIEVGFADVSAATERWSQCSCNGIVSDITLGS